ncbi:hypothetical protein B0H13DRAFT_2382728 [Mycena leptocephala]|nr:hypothetical protein B0H13DRAFT_2382728 [Mycena leptocephala]
MLILISRPHAVRRQVLPFLNAIALPIRHPVRLAQLLACRHEGPDSDVELDAEDDDEETAPPTTPATPPLRRRCPTPSSTSPLRRRCPTPSSALPPRPPPGNSPP